MTCYENEIYKLKQELSDSEERRTDLATCLQRQNKKVKELKAMIDKMTCCGNCNNYKPSQDHGYYSDFNPCNKSGCENCNKWELAE